MSTNSGSKGGEASEIEAMHRGRSRRGLWIGIGVAVVVILVVAYVALSGILTPPAHVQQTLLGAGATFPAPLVTLWTQKYANTTNGDRVNYQAVGSGTGITDLNNKAVDFGASDAPLQTKDRTSNTNLALGNVLHIPETIGAVTFAYNLPGIGTNLSVTGPVLVQIFKGTITSWNDPALTALNPGVSLPNQPIGVTHRSDSSGTSFVFTSYLHLSNSTAWNSSLVGKSITWPTGVGKPGNSGVAGYIAQTAYAAGYVELAYAVLNSMTVAKVKNPAGQFVAPSLSSTKDAADAAAPTLPAGIGDWANVSILNAPGATSYPISTFTYFLVYKELNNLGSGETQAKAQALVNWLWWAIHDGQAFSSQLAYVPLPASVVALDVASINSMTLNGAALVHS